MVIAIVILIVLAAFSISVAITGILERAFGISMILVLVGILLAIAIMTIKLDVRNNYTHNAVLAENNITLDNPYFKSYMLFYEK